MNRQLVNRQSMSGQLVNRQEVNRPAVSRHPAQEATGEQATGEQTKMNGQQVKQSAHSLDLHLVRLIGRSTLQIVEFDGLLS